MEAYRELHALIAKQRANLESAAKQGLTTESYRRSEADLKPWELLLAHLDECNRREQMRGNQLTGNNF